MVSFITANKKKRLHEDINYPSASSAAKYSSMINYISRCILALKKKPQSINQVFSRKITRKKSTEKKVRELIFQRIFTQG